MRLVLHIGTHKTGSTAIQFFCKKNRRLLKRHGILWPSEAPPEHPYQHAWIASCIRNGEINNAKKYIDRAYNEAMKANAHTLLMSSEDFSAISPQHLRQLVEILPDIDLQVIAYLRNVYDLTLSLLCEWTKQGALMERLRNWPNLVGSLNFDVAVKRWDDCFGEAAVEVRSYDQEKDRLVESFIQRLGVPKEDVEPNLVPTLDNASPDLMAMLVFQNIGYLSDIHAYHKWGEKYTKAFSGAAPRWPMLVELSELIVNNARMDFSHPKLQVIRDVLLRKPEVSIAENDKRQYLLNLRNLINDVLVSGDR